MNWLLKYKENILQLVVYFLILKLVYLGFDYLINTQFMRLFKIQELVSNDLSFNDLYYRIQFKNIYDKTHFTREKSVVLINTGSLSNDYFRLELANLINKVESCSPKAVGIDFIFSNNPRPGTEELKKVVENHPNIIIGNIPDNSETLKFNDKTLSGDISFRNSSKSIRYYSSSDSSFAFQLVKLANPDKSGYYKAKDALFPIHYCCVHDGLVNYQEETALFSEVNFKFMEAGEILNDSSDLQSFLNHKIVIIGHLGASCLPDRNSDLADKFCVPTDTLTLTNRDPVMYGAVIHANAVENILHPETTFREWNGTFYHLMVNLFYLAFLAFILFTDVGKFYNILIMTLLTIPGLYIVLWLMKETIYMTMGVTLINLLIIEEISEMIDPIYGKARKYFLNLKS
jgi:hypothetical protein